MNLGDSIYGYWSISTPVLVDLLKSEPMQRIKGVMQSGLQRNWTKFKPYSRYDHCVGVLLLLKRLGASLEEQVAGLLHDVSHTAFSHVIDYVFGPTAEHDFQDRHHEEYVRKTGLLDILKKHGLPERCALQLHEYPLLEQSAPQLCADRIDYTLRSALNEKIIDSARPFLSALAVRDNRIVFTSREPAEQFWNVYADRQDNHWGSSHHVAKYELLARAIKAGLDDRLLAMDDLYQTDKHVLEKLRASPNDTIKKSLHLLDNGFRIVETAEAPPYVLKKKFRYIDPAFLDGDRVRALSETMPQYAGWCETSRRKHEADLGVRIEPA